MWHLIAVNIGKLLVLKLVDFLETARKISFDKHQVNIKKKCYDIHPRHTKYFRNVFNEPSFMNS